MSRPDATTVRRKRRGGAPAVEISHGHSIAKQGEEVWSWSTPAGQARMAKRVELFVHSLGLTSRQRKVLELGCGTGLYTQRLAPFCKELVAVDISDVLLEQARQRVPIRSVRFVCQNLERVDAEETGRGFEAVFGCSVLHHLDLDATLSRLRHLLAPESDLAFSEPNLLNPQVRLMFSRFKWARRKWATSDTEMAFYPRELRSIFEQHGFEVHELFPFDFMHPAIPAKVVPLAQSVDRFLERTPLLRFLGGSYFIHARLRVTPS